MQIFDQEFYHIHRTNYHRDLWKQGKKVSTPINEYNHFFNSILTERHDKISMGFQHYNLIEYLNSNIEKIDIFNNSIDEQELKIENLLNIQYFNSHVISFLKQTFHALAQSRKMLRELIFEDYRKNHFPELPSRQKCFWLTDKKHLEKWWAEFNDNENKTIYKVSVTGNLFYADGSFIQMDILKFTDFENLANQYWSGQLNSNLSLTQKEILFEGQLKILSKHDNPSTV
jgi:hypothetical protein